MIIKVYIKACELGWIGERLATRQEFESLWNRGRGQYLALESGEVIQLAEGIGDKLRKWVNCQ